MAAPPLLCSACRPVCLRHESHLYISCFDVPTKVLARDHHPNDEGDHLLEHYVGYTASQPPLKRIQDHGRDTVTQIVLIVPGTQAEEDFVKASELCPRCGRPLWYFKTPPSTRDL